MLLTINRSIAFLNKTRKLWVSLFFIVLLITGFKIFSDYGISFDEPVSRENGAISFNHALKKFGISAFDQDQEIKKFKTDLNTYRDRDYGVAFDLPVFALERLFQLNDSRQQYLFKHLLTFFVFVLGVVAIYKLATRRFDDWKMGLITALMLVLSPRMFAESFYNGKDIVLMAMSAVALNTAIAFILKPTLRSAIIHGLATGIAIDVRIVAVIFPVMTVIALIIEGFRQKVEWRTVITLSSSYVLAMMIVVILFWPWLWSDPVGNFLTAFRNMSKFRWENFNLYLGEFISATKLPWHYPIVWIFITTPFLYTLFFMNGTWGIFFNMFKNKSIFWKNEKQLQDMFFLGLFAGPLIAIMYFKSVLYDGWRQLYFIYPAFLLVAANGIMMLWNLRENGHVRKVIICILLCGQLIYSATWMWWVHPFQNLYFNNIASIGKSELFEKDYWGLTNLNGLKYILEHDNRTSIRVAPFGATSLNQSIQLLPSIERERIQIVNSLSDADYVITNYRFFDGRSNLEQLSEFSIFYQIEIDDKNIFTIFINRKR